MLPELRKPYPAGQRLHSRASAKGGALSYRESCAPSLGEKKGVVLNIHLAFGIVGAWVNCDGVR